MVTRTFSSPQRGSFLSTERNHSKVNRKKVFVPSTGFFSIYAQKSAYEIAKDMFSSPQRGSFLSTIIQISSGADGIAVFSSPQRGSFLSTIMRERMVTRTVTRFRPLNGVLFYLHLKICLHLYSLNCFRPLNGVLFYLRNKT